MESPPQHQEQRPDSELYSTLEFDSRAYSSSQAPEVVAVDRENLPEVDHYRNVLPEVNHYANNGAPSTGAGGYAETYYTGGTYSTANKPQGAKEDAPYVGAVGDGGDHPPGSLGAGAAAVPGAASERRICGVRRKMFILLATLAVIIIVGVVVGVSVGVVTSNNAKAAAEQGNDGEDDDAAGKTNTTVDGPPNEVRLDTRIAATNFTDGFGNENYVIIYQLYNDMSTYNDSEFQSEWLVSPVVDGKTGSLSLDDVQNGTSFSIDTYVGTEPIMHLYWMGPDSKIMSARFDSFTTDTAHTAQDWYEAPASKLYVATPGSSLVSYGRECGDAPCPQWSYLFWQQDDAIEGAGLVPAGEWESLGPSLGASSGGFDSNGVTPPGANASMALAMSRATAADGGVRSLSMFYRAGSGVLGQIIYNRNTEKTPYRGYALPREDLGPRTGVAAFTTGTNDTTSSSSSSNSTSMPEPLGFQVLTADPDAGNGVQLTYYRDDAWTVAEEVPELADCQPLATMTATRARRVYCVVKTDDGKAQIVEFAWGGDPEADASSYSSYRRVGTVNTTVEL